MSTIPILQSASELLSRYDAVFCDVWGVVHNGHTAFVAGCTALKNYRAAGGTVILVSNAPRRATSVASILQEKHVPPDCWDAIVPSGDLALSHAHASRFSRVHHIGPDRDLDLFDASNLSRVGLEDCEALLCTGLIHDRVEQAEHYRPGLERALALHLPFICANPDLVVDVGGTLLPCAGAIAALYEEMGGNVHWAGKPFPAAYQAATLEAEKLRGTPVPKSKILAIGDAVRTDIAGAVNYGIDALFIGQGIHREAVMPSGSIDRGSLDELFAGTTPQAIAAMPGLAW